MKSAGKARNNGLYRHIRTSKEIIRNLLNDYYKYLHRTSVYGICSVYGKIQVIASGNCKIQKTCQGGNL